MDELFPPHHRTYMIEDIDQPGMKISVAVCSKCGSVVLQLMVDVHEKYHRDRGEI